MGRADKYNYGVVLDAGSSGTRVYVYKWLKNNLARLEKHLEHKLPQLVTKEKWTKKVHPGISTYGPTPELVSDHLKDLMKHASNHIPKAAIPNTPVFLLATAGMRLLPDHQRNAVLDSVCTCLKTETNFYVPDCKLHIQVIPGETEGLYGWIAANYLLGGFDEPQKHDHGKDHHTYGFLDLGGASAQIAFAPNSTEAEKHANDLTLLRLRTVDGAVQEYRVFITTWLGFGVNEARKRYVTALLESYGSSDQLEVPDPCLHNGLRILLDGTVVPGHSPALSEQHLLGTGAFDECMKRTLPLLNKDKKCLDEPCLINGQHVPAIDFDVNHFVGVSEYWHTTHEIFEMAHKDQAYDLGTYQKRISEFCTTSWQYIEAGVDDGVYGKKIDEKKAYEVCFKASWLINILHDGIGVPRIGIEKTSSSKNGTTDIIQAAKDKGYLDSFQAVNKIRDTEVSWTMGKMVLYAAADVPSAHDNDLPVGFGSNVKGVPADFQMPGGGLLQPGSHNVPSDSLTDKITDTLFDSDTPHRIPGFLLFVIIIFLGVFYYRRRTGGTGTSSTHTKKTLPSILASLSRVLGIHRKSPERDKALEEGNQRLYDPNDFELGAMDSSDEDTATGSKVASGYASPNVRRSKSSTALAGRLTPETIDRRGLLLKNGSREHFDLGSGRSKSRNGSVSPTRGSHMTS